MICDSHFQEVRELGAVYLVRRTNLMRDDGRAINITDEVEFKLPGSASSAILVEESKQ